MPRYFTLDEAERALPGVARALKEALLHKTEFEKADRELKAFTERIRMSGGSRVNPGAMLTLRASRDSHVTALKDALDRVEQAGALVKDLNIGLIDFMTLYHGREVCLCWKLGEDRIRYWHGAEEGFRGRKLIEQEFLDSHGGGTNTADDPN